MCNATGNPAPRVEWRKKGSDQPVSLRQRDLKVDVLKISAVGHDDLGIYLCVAKNWIGQATASIELGE